MHAGLNIAHYFMELLNLGDNEEQGVSLNLIKTNHKNGNLKLCTINTHNMGIALVNTLPSYTFT